MTELSDLSDEQRAVVETWGVGQAVLAGAGSGKTTTLVIKCEELLRRNPEARFAAVSFTEKSASDLREKLMERLGAKGLGDESAGILGRHWVMTIHGLCSAIIREFPREAGLDGEETMLSESEGALLWEQAVETLWFEEIPEEVQVALENFLDRENRRNLTDILRRVRDLLTFGAIASLRASMDPGAHHLATLAEYVVDRYRRLKARRGVLDFNDLEEKAGKVLESPQVRAKFQSRFDLVMVDEFQDTNQVQGAVIWSFVKPDRSNLCVVGDPKQSIYRFRDADVDVFNHLCHQLPKRQVLSWNFRSRPGIIESVNRVCAPAFEVSQLEYDGLVPKREVSDDFAPVERLDYEDPKQLANWIREENKRGVPLEEMALLLRRIRGNEDLLKALSTSGVPVAIGSGGLFWDDPRVRELTSFLRFWSSPANRLSGAVFLRAPWVGVPDEFLDSWLRQKDVSLLDLFLNSEHPLAQVLRPFRGRRSRPGELILALMVSDQIEAELGAPALGLWHRAEELSSRGLGFVEVVQELATSMEESRRDRDVPPPKNRGVLSVLTIHSSKGLEFPHVILTDMGDRARKPNAPLLFWDREQGAFLGLRDSKGNRDKKAEDPWRKLEDQKTVAESKRLFYVALTRAQERLILAFPPLKKEIPLDEAAYQHDDWRAWTELGEIELPQRQLTEVAQKESEGGDVLLSEGLSLRQRAPARLKRPRHSVTEWTQLGRCERYYEWQYVRPRLVEEKKSQAIDVEPGVEFEKNGPTQTEIGTRVHAALETRNWADLLALEAEVGTKRFKAETVIEWAESDALMVESENLLDQWNELAFEIPIDGEVIVGALDRLVKHQTDEGIRYTIVDFKVTRRAKSEAELLEAYERQLQIYAWAIQQIEPEAKGRVEALLVNFSAEGVNRLEVPLGDFPAESVVARAKEIIAGREGVPQPGKLCDFCSFREVCEKDRGVETCPEVTQMEFF